jgi:hypothetical protein
VQSASGRQRGCQTSAPATCLGGACPLSSGPSATLSSPSARSQFHYPNLLSPTPAQPHTARAPRFPLIRHYQAALHAHHAPSRRYVPSARLRPLSPLCRSQRCRVSRRAWRSVPLYRTVRSGAPAADGGQQSCHRYDCSRRGQDRRRSRRIDLVHCLVARARTRARDLYPGQPAATAEAQGRPQASEHLPNCPKPSWLP